jgi:hypothetical protein
MKISDLKPKSINGISPEEIIHIGTHIPRGSISDNKEQLFYVLERVLILLSGAIIGYCICEYLKGI